VELTELEITSFSSDSSNVAPPPRVLFIELKKVIRSGFLPGTRDFYDCRLFRDGHLRLFRALFRVDDFDLVVVGRQFDVIHVDFIAV
jgi:hypothetical protein